MNPDQFRAEARANQDEADRVRQSNINFEAAATLVALAKLTEEQAKAVVAAIARGRVPSVRIDYR